MRKQSLMIVLVALLVALLPAQAQTDITGVVAQRFESGEMIYREDTGTIYALVNARSADAGTAWVIPSRTYGEWPQNDLRAPDDALSPTDGFGQVWANNTALRNALGWATLEPVGYETQIVVSGGVIYIETLEGIIYAINDGTWSRVDDLPSDDDTPAQIERIVISPESVAPGGSLTVEWAVSGDNVDFAQVRVFDPISYLPIEPILDPGESSLFLPTTGALTYPIPDRARGDLLVSVSAVERGYLYSTNDLAVERRTVPLAVDNQTYTFQAAYQDYENGFMLWQADTDVVLVFYDNGTYAPYPESSYADAPSFNGSVPEGFVAPINAFGRVWGFVRDNIGYALDLEQGYEVIISQAANANVTYTLPDGRTIRVDPAGFGTWTFD